MLTVDFSLFPVLLTARLELREIRIEDADALLAMRSDARVMEFIGRPLMTERQEATDLIERILADRSTNAGITWAMALKGGTAMIGTIGFYRLKLEHHIAEVGYMLSADHWDRGFMSEALEAVCSLGFHRYRFHRIEAITAPGNAASRHLLEKCGFALEGILHENFLANGAFEDSCHFARLAPVREEQSHTH
ncbi:MAG: GNAT family N-acetyltransferase [Flavobacteriales bacterium]|nr:GNAT family N-acetyltransferase [Flavobacteriales bacterium]